MRYPRVLGTVAAVAALTAAAAVAPAAAGAEQNHVRVTNRPLAAGAVHLAGWCDHASQRSTTTSPVLVAPVEMTRGRPGNFALVGTGQVKPGTAPGTYDLSMTCGPTPVRGKITVHRDTVGRPALLVTPIAGTPGSTVKLVGICEPVNELGQPSSPALAGKLRWKQTGRATYEVTAKVAAVTPGQYVIEYYCGAGLYSRIFTVLDGGKPAPPPGPGQVKDKPKGGVETGGGLS